MAWCGTKKAKKLLTMDPASILVFDLETTGTNPQFAEILQISLTDGNGCVLFSSYVKPKHRKSWPGAEKVNHISPAMVESAPSFDEIRAQIQDFFNRAKLIAGYNSKNYDIPIIERYGVVVPQNRFDVMEEFRLFTGRTIGYRLTDCAKYFHQSYTPHDATEDAGTTANCMQALIREAGFVNLDPSKPQKKGEEALIPEERPNKRPLRARLLSPFLKKRRIPPAIKGILVMLLSLLWLCYQAYGNAFITNAAMVEISGLVEAATAGPAGLAAGVLFIVGAMSCVWGIIRAAIKLVRWIINLLRRVFKKLFG